MPPHVRQSAAMYAIELTGPSLSLVPPPPPSPLTAPFESVAIPPMPLPFGNGELPQGFEPLPSQGPELQRPVPSPDELNQRAHHPQFPIDLPALLRSLEDAYITAALAQAGGNRKAAADLLGLQRTTLVEKLRRRQRDAQAA